ncbi:hypothetical protein BDP55DRAFT_316040 [Colletotrichum godetiae]|uniref:Uncharacterized protein n=1 Tax=Colletotrichum godetiae TaxID=1209918 RepID=A0AAJ0AV92_9PEZI|nr:uncharacterized protein BDP55DRAFT_316040 [Colletotrichum godetiae]KAK1691012.1 hypothetical protein BDP55DRAFT_316040 [Colletotrichum godetiae]
MANIDVETLPSESEETSEYSSDSYRSKSRSRTRTRSRRYQGRDTTRSPKPRGETAASRDINEFGVEIKHVTTQFYRDRRGQYRTSKRLGIPSEGENHAANDLAPRVTFFHDVDELGNFQGCKIEVDWWEFDELLESLERFPLDRKSPSARATTFSQPFAPLFLRLDALKREVPKAEAVSPMDNNGSTTTYKLGVAKAILSFIGENARETQSRLEALSFASPSTLVQYDDL